MLDFLIKLLIILLFGNKAKVLVDSKELPMITKKVENIAIIVKEVRINQNLTQVKLAPFGAGYRKIT